MVPVRNFQIICYFLKQFQFNCSIKLIQHLNQEYSPYIISFAHQLFVYGLVAATHYVHHQLKLILICRYSRASLNMPKYTKSRYNRYDAYSFQLERFTYVLYHFFQDEFISARLQQLSTLPISTLLSWNSAEQLCQENKGHLVSITDQKEMDNVLNMIKAVPRMVMSIYIGLQRKVNLVICRLS